MSLILGVEQLVRLMVLAWIDIKRAAVWSALTLVLCLHILVLWMCADPTFPAWSGWVVPLFQLRFGDLFLHYPQSMIGLPVTGSGFRLVVDVLMGPCLASWILWTSLDTARSRLEVRPPFQPVGVGHYFKLLVYGVLVTAFWVVIDALAVRWLQESELLPYRQTVLASYLWGYVPTLALVPVFFTLAAMVDTGASLVSAVKRSASLVRSNRMICTLLAILPHTLGLPFVILLNRSSVVAEKLRPELVFVVMVFQSIVSLAVTYLLLNASARLWARRRRGEVA